MILDLYCAPGVDPEKGHKILFNFFLLFSHHIGLVARKPGFGDLLQVKLQFSSQSV